MTHRFYPIPAFVAIMLMAGSFLSAQDWQFVTGAMNGSAIGPNGTMIAVGDRGIIFRTTDDGSSWELPLSGTYQNLRDVDFITQTDVVVVGSEGTILISKNSGESWEAVNAHINQLLFKVVFLNSQTGFALGTDSLFGSNDGGNSWHPVAALPDKPESVAFMNESEGILTTFTGHIYRTTNGGKNWTAVYVDTTQNFRTVKFFNDGRTGFVCGPLGGLLKTVDSGQTWTFTGGADSGMIPFDLAVREDGIILLVGAARNSERIIIQRSENFAKDWQVIPLETKFSGLLLTDVSLNLQGKGLICSNMGSLLLTDDAWESHVTITEPTYEFPGSSIAILKQPAFATERIGIAPNPLFPGGYIRTTDAGKTWLARQYAGGTLNSPTFFSGSYGIIQRGSPGLIYQTTDAGESWNPAIADVVPGGGTVVDMQFFNPRYGLQIGDTKLQNRLGGDRSGIVYITKDSGKSWNGTAFDWPPAFSDVEVLPDGTALIAGGAIALNTDSANQFYSYGKILRTTDNGASWDTVYDRYGAGAFPSILGFRDENKGYIIVGGDDWGYPGLAVILETTNGGDSWQVLRSFDRSKGEYAPVDMIFLNDSIWYGVGGNASIWRITDSGRNWVQEIIDPLPQTFQNRVPALYAITLLPDDRTVMIFGQGAILRRSFPKTFSYVREHKSNQAKDIQLLVSPNPAQDEIRVTWQGVGTGTTIRMYTMLGEEVLIERFFVSSPGIAIIDAEGLAAGSYQIVLFDVRNQRVGSATVVVSR